MEKSKTKRYILVGATGDLTSNTLLDFPAGPGSVELGALAGVDTAATGAAGVLAGLTRVITAARPRRTPMKVVRSLHENGPKLVEMQAHDALALRAAKPGVKVIEEVFYRLAAFDPVSARLARGGAVNRLSTVSPAAGSFKNITVRVMGKDGKPIEGARVGAFWDLDADLGDDGVTGKDGTIKLRVRGKLERLYVRPRSGHWSRMLDDVAVRAGQELKVTVDPLEVNFQDGRKYFYGTQPATNTVRARIRVAVIDGGIGPHPELKVKAGRNFTGTEPEGEHQDNGLGHGTHVAGIIAGRGDEQTGVRGLAPAVELFSYRVCAKADDEVSSFALGAAIEAAVKAKCHLLNLSLALSEPDEYVELWVKEAWNRGCLVVAAVGNGYQKPVGFPAALPTVIGVSAFGRKRTFPADAEEAEMVDKPLGSDKNNFFAAFSNMGNGVDFTAPGVGIISTFPGDGYAVMSGTSMACPIITGMAARLLSEHKEIVTLTPNAKRSEKMAQLLFSQAKKIGFGTPYEGYGLCATR